MRTTSAHMGLAADMHAQANRTDPFARGRMMLHLKNGIENPVEVIKEAKRLLGIGPQPKKGKR
jgi:hypothetical protein